MKNFFYSIHFLLLRLTLSAQKYSPVKIGMCTDTHLPTMHDAEYRLTTFLEAMKKEKPDFIIELGDFATPAPKYAKYFEMWNAYPGDKYHLIGNHEMDGGTSREKAIEYRGMESGYYSFDKNGFHFIVLDGNDKKNPDEKGYKQYIGPEQFEWLKAELAATTSLTVIFSHQGISYYRSADEDMGVENYREVRQLLVEHNRQNPEARVIACFNGHSHWEVAEKLDGIRYVTISSLSYRRFGEGYGHIRYSPEIDKEYKWIKYTAPFKEPLFTTVKISPKGTIKIAGKKSEWVGPTPWEVGYPVSLKKYMRPAISKRKLKF